MQSCHYFYIFSIVLDCGAPSAIIGVTIEPVNDTKFGSLITFHCDEDNITMTVVCESNGEWIPNPASLKCGNESSGITIIIILFYRPKYVTKICMFHFVLYSLSWYERSG